MHKIRIVLLILYVLNSSIILAQPKLDTIIEARDCFTKRLLNSPGGLRLVPQEFMNKSATSFFQIKTKKGNYVFEDDPNYLITLNDSYPKGVLVERIIDKAGAVSLKSNIYFYNPDSLTIYLNYLRDGVADVSGPLYYYAWRDTTIRYYDKTEKEYIYVRKPSNVTACQLRDNDIYVQQIHKEDSKVSEALLDKGFVRSHDAIELVRKLNTSIDLTTISTNDEINFPPLLKVTSVRRRKFKTRFKEDAKPDEIELFNAKTLLDSLEVLANIRMQKLTTAKSLLGVVSRFKSNVLNSLELNQIKDKCSLNYLNSQLKILNKLLIREDENLPVDLVLNVLTEMEKVLILPIEDYTNKDLFRNIFPSNSFNYLSATKPDVDDFKFRFYLEDKKTRPFNFYVYKSNSKGVPIWDSASVKFQYEVYCIPAGIYELYSAGKINFEVLSEYACAERASVSNKSLRLAPYYFFATKGVDRKIVSNIRITKTSDIPKKSLNSYIPRPFSHCIIVNE